MKRHVVFAVMSLMLFIAPLYAAEETPCDKCRNEANKELAKCLGSAISEEDKKSCTEKAEERMNACKELE